MHIEPHIVTGAKLALSYGTAAVALGGAMKLTYDHIRAQGLASLLLKGLLATVAVFVFFEVFFHHPVGVSEVHLILGTSLLLILGAAPAALGLAAGLLLQGFLMAPADLPQYGMNVTTLLVPLFALTYYARRVVPAGQAYVDLRYRQVLPLSILYQGGIIAWVAFWALYGQGFNAANLAAVGSFGLAYLSVIVLEPLADLAVLALAKGLRNAQAHPMTGLLLNRRLFQGDD